MNRSLTKRIIALSIFWIFVALIVTALLLGEFYLRHIEEHYDGHVRTHVEELVASVDTAADGTLKLVVAGDADNGLIPEYGPGLLNRGIIFTEMHAVCADGFGQLDLLVGNAGGPAPAGPRGCGRRRRARTGSRSGNR